LGPLHVKLSDHGWPRWKAVLVRAAVSAALAVPCFWQPSIPSQDLSSHIYNVWLAQQIREHKPPNLELRVQPTNILFDLLLEQSIARFGFDFGPNLLMAVMVLTFFWAGFAFVRAAGRTHPLVFGPMLAMAAYGWVFYMGLANFYLATGLSFLFLTLVRKRKGWPGWVALLVLALAAAAHLMPALWAFGVELYRRLYGQVQPARRRLLFAAAVALLPAMHLALRKVLVVQWEARQLLLVTGVDQFAVFGYKYLAIIVGVFYLWGYAVYQKLRLREDQGWLGTPLCHWFGITAAAAATLPDAVQLPSQPAPLAFLAQRMSLWLLVLLCGMLPAPIRLRPFGAAAMALAALYFSFLYADARALNRLERRMTGLLSGIPAGSRVINSIQDSTSRIDPLLHMVDRTCLGRCFSYANYEPASGHFRVLALGPNPLVLWNRRDIERLELGFYRVQERDLPLHQFRACSSTGEICLHALNAGEVVERVKMRLLPLLW
ncbi:MAG: hypothetical protein K6T61_07205, partial [Bryobacteraceae bacterium]|nr:hypothetical protein [Bryobacteraceae bacterium]